MKTMGVLNQIYQCGVKKKKQGNILSFNILSEPKTHLFEDKNCDPISRQLKFLENIQGVKN